MGVKWLRDGFIPCGPEPGSVTAPGEGKVNRPRKASAVFVSLATTLVVSASGCSNTADVAANRSAVPAPTHVDGPTRVAGYSAVPGKRELTIFVTVDQLATLRGVSVVSEDPTQVIVSADLSRRSGNAVGMLGYVWGTVYLAKPLGPRRVVDTSGTVVRPIALADVGPTPGPERTTWAPG
ncbi:hypothetical protein GCM10009740_22880 [Terrabacter terrae]|uniref:Uncharacterized protein n=1 Tax=Terrabacter terrae TaxID=318434 RepID=A0ABN2UAD2_9MICO